jgi:hypothetical protein
MRVAAKVSVTRSSSKTGIRAGQYSDDFENVMSGNDFLIITLSNSISLDCALAMAAAICVQPCTRCCG